MRLKMAIRGIGAVGGFGCGVAALERALAGAAPTPETITLDTIHGPRAVRGLRADTGPLRDLVPVRVMRRMEHHIRVALLAAFGALADAEGRGFGPTTSATGRRGILMATGFGATCNSFDFQHLATASDDFSGSPTQFSNSVHNAAAAHLSIALTENGPNHTVSHYDLSVPMALTVAAQWLAEERVDTVLLGAVDEFSKARAHAWEVRAQRDAGAARLPAIGEGACFLVLTRADAATGADPGAAYALIDTVGMGRQPAAGPLAGLPPAEQYFIGADGFSPRDEDYAAALPPDRPATAYAHAYGVLPVGMAFDLAAAALALAGGRSFAGCRLPSTADPSALGERPLGAGDRLCCLKLGAHEAHGWARLTASGRM